MVKEDIGLFLLGGTGAFAIWSATNSSEFTLMEFVDTPEKAEKARRAMLSGFLWNLLFAGAVFLVFQSILASVGIIVFASALYVRFDMILKEKGF